MPADLLIHALIRAVILVVLAVLAVRSGYRIGFRDSAAGRPARIPLLELDDDPDDSSPNPDRTSIDLLACTLEGTVTGLSVHVMGADRYMALFTLVDGSRSTVCAVFPKVFSACGGVLSEGAHVRVTGRLESSIHFFQLAVTAVEPLT